MINERFGIAGNFDFVFHCKILPDGCAAVVANRRVGGYSLSIAIRVSMIASMTRYMDSTLSPDSVSTALIAASIASCLVICKISLLWLCGCQIDSRVVVVR